MRKMQQNPEVRSEVEQTEAVEMLDQQSLNHNMDDFIMDIAGPADVSLWEEIFGGFDHKFTTTHNKEEEVQDRPVGQTKSRQGMLEFCEARKYVTHKDREICCTDMPERFQLRSVPVESADDNELEEEAKWIFRHVFSTPTVSWQEDLYRRTTDIVRKGKDLRTIVKIKEILSMMRNQHFEVPFIAFYRKEYVEPELSINDLWNVWQWDEKWTHLRNCKQNLRQIFHRMQSYQREHIFNPDKSLTNGIRPLNIADMERLNNLQTFDELRDIYRYFLLHYSQDIPKMPDSVKVDGSSTFLKDLNQVSHGDMYNICQSAGLQSLANKFGLTPEQFGENLRHHCQRHKLEQFSDEPIQLAKDYVCRQFPTPEEVLEATRYMVAVQIAREPLIQHVLRQTFQERANVNIKPTKKGKKEIDETHFAYSFKYIKNKPVKRLNGDEFLKMYLAEEKGLLTIDIGVDMIGAKVCPLQTYSDEIKQFYYREGFSHQVQEWNKQWALTVDKALTQFLYPQFSKELKGKLVTEARENIIRSCCRRLFNWLKVAPYRPDQKMEKDLMHESQGKGLRVLGVAYAPSRDTQAFCALINGEGEVIDVLCLPYLMERRNSEDEKAKKANDIQNLKTFLKSKQPHVVAVAGENRDANMLVEDIKRTICELQQESYQSPVQVELVDNKLATLYMNSKTSQSDFGKFPPLLRQAVSIARKIQDPLSEYAHVCNSDEGILRLKLHPLQENIGKEELLSALHCEFINRVSEVGVDINRALANPYTQQSLVQYVCGLGPRKGSHLLNILRQKNTCLENRAQLETLCHMGPTVYINCAGFIKIDTVSIGVNTDSYIRVLDSSRIHPESYKLACKMAADAMGYDGSAKDANVAVALDEILKNPEHLKDLDMDTFTKELERQGYGKKEITLLDIRAELSCRYKDLRVPYRPPNTEQIFFLLTNETPETFYIGKLITSVVKYIVRKFPQGRCGRQVDCKKVTGMWQCPLCLQDFPEINQMWTHLDNRSCPGKAVGVRTMLDNGVQGFICTNFLSDNVVKRPEDRFKKGMMVYSRITNINMAKFSVELTCRTSDLMDNKNDYKPLKDNYYDFDMDRSEKDEEQRNKKEQQMPFLKRMSLHPKFHNVDFKLAEEILESMNQGDFIFRPSSKGRNCLAVTWKVAEGIHQHLLVSEEGKDNDLSLGHKLRIGTEEFDNLDEIAVRYIRPMAGFARDLTRHHHFQECSGGDGKKMEELLLKQKRENPRVIPYLISACKDLPGTFILGYQPGWKPLVEHVEITSQGLWYRSQMFPKVMELFNWFKIHSHREPLPSITLQKSTSE